MAASLKVPLQCCVTEIAFEASELLRTDPKTSSSALEAVSGLVKNTTIRGQDRVAAKLARDGVGGISDYLVRSGRAYEKTTWYAELKTATGTWSEAATRDLKSFTKATDLFAKTAAKVAGDLAKLPAKRSAEAIDARALLDALTEAVLDRAQRIRAADPDGTKTLLPDTLIKQLAASLSSPPKGPADLAAYWRAGKKGIDGKLPAGMDAGLANKLSAWQKLAGSATAPDKIAAATYDTVETLVDYRSQIEKGANARQDKAKLLALIDDLLTEMSVKLAALT